MFDRSDRAALMPYLTAGFPEPKATLPLLNMLADAGADAIELGVPFSDPLADGPVIQRASQQALAAGMTLEGALRIARAFRRCPLYLMSYANPIVAYGLKQYFRDARCAAGTIVPDLPPEESDGWAGPLVYLCAPTTSSERIRLIDRRSHDFIYLVSLKGVTGAALPANVGGFVRRVRRLTSRPLCVGFGISTPAQAHAVARIADGVIVGSALIRAVERGGAAAFVRRLAKAVRR